MNVLLYLMNSVNYDGYAGERGELKAFYEFIIENNVDYEWIGMNGKPIDKHLNHNQQVGLIIHSINNYVLMNMKTYL